MVRTQPPPWLRLAHPAPRRHRAPPRRHHRESGMNETANATTVRIYANAGWRVFPIWWITDGHCTCPRSADCTSPGKHPVFPPAHPAKSAERSTCKGACGKTGHGLYDATNDPSIVGRWWARYPLAHIGLPADPNGLAILDVDPKNGGAESETKLRNYLT